LVIFSQVELFAKLGNMLVGEGLLPGEGLEGVAANIDVDIQSAAP
jgi:hypothetical protein